MRRPVIIALLVLSADQLIKVLLGSLKPDWLLGNRGVAFGLPINYPTQLTLLLVLLVVVTVLLVQAWQQGATLVVQGTTLFLAGGLSNLIDRLRTGSVVDFLPIGFGWRVNLGDLMIVIGLMMLIWFVIRPNDEIRILNAKPRLKSEVRT